MQAIDTCRRCNKRAEPYFREFDGCKCTEKQKREHGEEEFRMMQKSFNHQLYQEPSIKSCIEILEGNGYRVNKVNKNKLKRARKAKHKQRN